MHINKFRIIYILYSGFLSWIFIKHISCAAYICSYMHQYIFLMFWSYNPYILIFSRRISCVYKNISLRPGFSVLYFGFSSGILHRSHIYDYSYLHSFGRDLVRKLHFPVVCIIIIITL